MSDKFAVECPSCNHTQHVAAQYENKRGKCVCGHVFVLQRKPDTPAPAARPREVPRPQPATPSVPQAIVAGKYCTACGEGLHIYAEICPHCGVRQPQLAHQGTVSGSNKKILPALILCLFLGFIGAHSFYAGRLVLGILYLFLFLTGLLVYLPLLVIPFLLLFDLVFIVVGGYKDSEGRYISDWV